MNRVDVLTNAGRQKLQLILQDGSTVNMELQYVDNQKGWFYSLTHSASSFAVTNRRVVTSPNMLRAWRHIINWGLACVTVDGEEPVFVDDFFNARASLYVLDEADVLTVEEMIKIND